MIAFSIRQSYIDQPSDVSNVFLDNLLLLILLKLFNRKLHSVHTKQDRQLELTLPLYISISFSFLLSLLSIFFLSLFLFFSFFPYFSFFLSFLISLSFFSFQDRNSSTSHFGSHSDAVKKLAISDYLIKIHILPELTFNLYGHISKVACKGQRSRLFSRI